MQTSYQRAVHCDNLHLYFVVSKGLMYKENYWKPHVIHVWRIKFVHPFIYQKNNHVNDVIWVFENTKIIPTV